MKKISKIMAFLTILFIFLSTLTINTYAVIITSGTDGKVTTETYTGNVDEYGQLEKTSNLIEPDLQETEIDISGGKLVVKNLANDDETVWNTIFAKYKTFIIGFTGVCTLTCLLAFIMCFMKLGANANNPSSRSSAMTGCLVTGIGTALLGAITIVFGFFFNAI